MNIRDAFPSNYLKAAELRRELTVTIESLALEAVGSDQKPVLRFKEIAASLVVNRTNAAFLASKFGQETDMWRGKLITLFVVSVPFRGQTVPAIRIKAAAQALSRQHQQPPDDFNPNESQDYNAA